MNRNKRGLVIFIAMLVITALAAGLAKGGRTGLLVGDYVAVVNVVGTIEESGTTYDQQWFLDTIDELTADPANQGILLYIDSPGGTVYESDEAYLKLMDYKAITGRPVYAAIAHYGASGAYYIAAAADEIYANRNRLTGSIGVIMGSAVDMTQLMDKLGIKMTTFHAGANKNMLAIDEPVTDEQHAIMQSILDESYDQFVGIVAESRHMTVDAVRALADGRIYTAQQAADNGLIDGVRTYEETLAKLMADASVPYGSAYYYSYEKETHWLDELLGLKTALSGQDAAAGLGELSKALAPVQGPAYYYAY